MMIGFVNYIVPKPPDRVVIKVDPRVYDAYVGSYEFDSTAVVTILTTGGKLFLEANGQRVELLPISETIFVPEGRDSRITFLKSATNEVTGFVTFQNDTLSRFKKKSSSDRPAN